MIWSILGLLLVGLIVGAIGRLFISSPQRLGCLGTAALGLIGSYAGGTIGALLFDDKWDIRKASTFIGAIAGTMLVLAIWRAIDDRR